MNDPFNASFVQTFTADMERAEGAGNDVVVACAYTVCDEDQHVVDGACVDCIPGSIRPAGDRTDLGTNC